MSVLTTYFDYECNPYSPIIKDYERKVNYDEKGNEFITYEEVDTPSIQKENGIVDNWSLSALMKAGIDPNFPIHTSFNTRLEGIGTMESWVKKADEIANENNVKSKEE